MAGNASEPCAGHRPRADAQMLRVPRPARRSRGLREIALKRPARRNPQGRLSPAALTLARIFWFPVTRELPPHRWGAKSRDLRPSAAMDGNQAETAHRGTVNPGGGRIDGWAAQSRRRVDAKFRPLGSWRVPPANRRRHATSGERIPLAARHSSLTPPRAPAPRNGRRSCGPRWFAGRWSRRS
jgi:hypothetical protein